MSHAGRRILCTVFILLGIANILIGLNVGLGGICTLGWQGDQPFLEITNERLFLVQDSHIRFFGGLYFTAGAFLVFATSNLQKYRTALTLVLFMIFTGGLARFSMMRSDILFSARVVGSLTTELLLMPILCVWLWKITTPNEEARKQDARRTNSTPGNKSTRS